MNCKGRVQTGSGSMDKPGKYSPAVQRGEIMKKYFGLVLVLLCSLSMTACGVNDKGALEKSQSQSQKESGSQEGSLSQEDGRSQESGQGQGSVSSQEGGQLQESGLSQESGSSSGDGSDGKGTSEAGAPSQGSGNIMEISPAAGKFLEEMCFYLPEFEDVTSLDDQFWHDFIFLSYTGYSGDEGAEIISVYREDLEYEEPEVKVSREAVAAYVRLALGLELPDYQPSFEDMGTGQTACYYEDGYYYIGMSDFPNYQFSYKEVTLSEDNRIMAEVTAAFEDQENVGSVYFELEPADNENGFIIVKKIWDIHFD